MFFLNMLQLNLECEYAIFESRHSLLGEPFGEAAVKTKTLLQDT